MITEKSIKAATMWINDQDISDYGVLVESFSTGGTERDNSTYQGENSSRFTLLKAQYKMLKIRVNLFYWGKSRREITLKKSKIDGMLFGDLELKLPDGFFYHAVCDSCGDLTILGVEGNKVIGLVAYELRGIRHDELETIVAPYGNTVYCRSTAPYTNCRLSCTASRAYSSITIDTVTITGVASGDQLVVDGILGRILQNGAPCAGNMSFVRFPQLMPGVNIISAPEPVTIEYYPTYI